VIQTDGQCSIATVTRCAAPLATFGSNYSFTEASLTQACSKLGNSSDCLLMEGCPENDTNVRKLWTGLKDGFNFLCGEGREAFKKNEKCLGSTGVLQGLGKCSDVYNSALKSGSVPLCAGANAMLACMQKGVVTCGLEAARVLVVYAYKTLAPPASVVNCTLNIDQVLAMSSSVHVTSSLVSLFLPVLVLLVMSKSFSLFRYNQCC